MVEGEHINGSILPMDISKQGDFEGRFIVDISCSHFSCLAQTDEGEVVGWGREALIIKEGINLPPCLSVLKPTLLKFIDGKVKGISSGRFHHAFLT